MSEEFANKLALEIIVKGLIFALIVFSGLVQAAAGPKFYISQDVFKNSKLPFISHQGSGPFDSYLTMEVNFEPVADLFKQLLIAKRVPLTNRGEAHITVITPVEFTEILKSKLTMTEIDEIAQKNKIQNAKFEVVCVGKGSLDINAKTEWAFYLVVRTPDLLRIREEIQKAFVAKGGDKEFFKPQYFYPHITLGYTERDLHISDGVIKDESSCAHDLDLKK